MKLGIELTSGAESEDVFTVRRICEAARRQGHQVSLFVMCDGVFNLHTLKELVLLGVEIVVCHVGARERGMQEVEGVRVGSQHDWALIVLSSDSVIAFG